MSTQRGGTIVIARIASLRKDFWNIDVFFVLVIMKTYNENLRKKVMLAVDRGEIQCSIAKRFIISEKSIYLWRKQREERGIAIK